MILSKTKIILIITSVLLTLAITVSVSLSLARYMGKIESEHFQASSNFYFSSDLLSTSSPTYNVVGQNAFDIELKNYDNNLSFTSKDITFTVITTGASVSGGSPSGNTYVLQGGSARFLSLTITPSSNTFSVSVSTSAPYTKTLSANFNVINQYTSYALSEVVNTSEHLIMEIVVGNAIPTITVEWDTTKFSHDNTNSLLANATANGSSASAVLTGLVRGRTYQIMFFKIGSVNADAVSSTNITNSSTTIVLPS